MGSAMVLRATDQINGSHRGHHQFLAKSLRFVAPEGLPADDSFSGDVLALARTTLAEIMGLSEGFCRGRGGSMHLRWREAGNLGTNAIVGGGAPLAAGAAWCQKRAGRGDVVVTYFGDGAVNIGSVLETMNLAAAWRLPLCFFIENNRYAVSTTVEESTAEPRLSARGLGFSIPAWKVDGMDTLAVLLAMEEAAALMRDGGGPTIIEADVYRFFHQNGPLPGSAFGYRTKDEEAAWRERDPLEQLARHAMERQIVGADALKRLRDGAVHPRGRLGRRRTRTLRPRGPGLQGRADRGPGARRGRRRRVAVYERAVHRSVPRPALPEHRAREGVQAAVGRGRLLARPGRQPDADPDLRHRVPVRQGPGRAPRAPRAGARPRPSPDRPGAGAVQLLPGLARLSVLAARRHGGVERAGGAAGASRTARAATARSRPRSSTTSSCGSSRATGTSSARTCISPRSRTGLWASSR